MTVTSEQRVLSSKLTRMARQPFGLLDDGTSVDEIKGNLVRGLIDYMFEFIAEHAAASLPAGMPDGERAVAIKQAQADALTRLVALLNEAVPDERFPVTAALILDANNKYTTEFWLFTADYCRIIAGDPDFFSNYGRNRIPSVIVQLMRPLSVQRIYQLVPQLARNFVRADVRAVAVTPNSATLRWYGRRQEDPLLNEIHMTLSSLSYRNFLSSVPEQLHGLEPATVEETGSMLSGADYYEWIFRWQETRASYNRWLALGLLAALVLVIIQLWLTLPITLLLVLAVLAPIIFGWSFDRFNRLRFDHNQKERLLAEQHKVAQEQYEQSQAAKTQLQVLNMQLQRKVNEFSALHEVRSVLNTTLDLETLIERSLEAVIDHLHFDRALVLLVDEANEMLTHGASAGGSVELQAAVASLGIPLAHRDNFFVNLFYADGPAIIRETVPPESAAGTRLSQIIDTREHLGTPIIAKGRRLGVLSVDNRYSSRPISEHDASLVFLVAGQIAVAIENALLYREVALQKQTLEQRVTLRTAELAAATQAAQMARRVAEDANAAKSSFLSNVSHELRTPLTSVLGFAKVIKGSLERRIWPIVTPGDDRVDTTVADVRENLDIIISEGERLTNLINEVLDLAKIEAGKVEWAAEKVAIDAVVAQAIQATTTLAKAKDLALLSQVEAAVPSVQGDRNKLMQVLINLISNAIKFTPAGSITCHARAAGAAVEVSVSDTGIGIPAADLPRVFDVFRQVGDTLTERPHGSGLGLAICKEIVERHGGQIWVESEVGVGSTFTFSLPVTESELE